MKIVIGSGIKPREGWINIDNNPKVNPDIIRDVLTGLPFNDEFIDEVLCEHFLEHLDGKEMIFLMNEIWRVLKFGKTLSIEVPNGINSIVDPTHKKIFFQNSLDFWVIPDYNSRTAGVNGWFYPLEFIIEDKRLFWKLRKESLESISNNIKDNKITWKNFKVQDLRTKK